MTAPNNDPWSQAQANPSASPWDNSQQGFPQQPPAQQGFQQPQQDFQGQQAPAQQGFQAQQQPAPQTQHPKLDPEVIRSASDPVVVSGSGWGSGHVAPDTGLGAKLTDDNGCLLVMRPRDIEYNVKTKHGVSEKVGVADWLVCDGPNAGQIRSFSRVFQRAISARIARLLESGASGQFIVGRLHREEGQGGKTTWLINNPTPEEEQLSFNAAVAAGWVTVEGQQPAQQQAPAPQQGYQQPAQQQAPAPQQGYQQPAQQPQGDPFAPQQ